MRSGVKEVELIFTFCLDGIIENVGAKNEENWNRT